MTGWGDKAMIYNFKGYKEGKLVCEKSYGPSNQFSYRFEVSQQALQNAATYDVARVSIKFVDEWGSQMHYAHNVVSFKTMGPLQVIGPKQVALQGGDVSVYVRSQFVTRSMEARLDRLHRSWGLPSRFHGSITPANPPWIPIKELQREPPRGSLFA
jgi:hypothetical protein